ncbi:MAG: TonB family protein [Acidobacteriaceae bacterium]|nr:TonB family protein [Acidobacteriaceae bacterium]
MSGVRAISPADDSTESHYVKSIRSVCSMHTISIGSPQHLAAFLKALGADKLLAMEFWSMVARLSDESSELSISAMNGVVIEVVMQAVTGRSVAEMVAAGREPRRLVGELGCLLAGEDLNSLIEISPPEAAPDLVEALDAKAAASDPKASDVDKLRADVALLKAAFEAQFGMEAAHPSAPLPIARGEQEEPVTPVPSQASKDTESAIQPAELREPILPAPRAQAGVTHHSVYAEAQALSSGQRESWSYQAIAPATPVPAAVLAETLPIPAALESESSIAATLEPPVPAAQELSIPASERLPILATQQPSIPTPSSTAPSATKVTPIPRPKLEVKPVQSTSIHAVPVAETGLAGPEDSSKRILMGATLLLLVGVGLSAPWWFRPKAVNPTNVTTGSGSTGVASDSTPIPTGTASVPAPSHPKPNRPPEKTPNKLTAETRQDNPESASESEPAKLADSAKNGSPQSSIPPPPAANAGTTLSVAPANTAATTATATPSPAPRLTTASAILPPAAATAERTAPAPVVRIPPVPERPSTPHAVSGGMMEGAKISGQNPIYPAFAKTAHISGSVVLHAMISKAGTVENLKVVSGPLTLQQSAIAAVKTWKYKPYLLNGEPTEVDTSIVVNFHLVD